MAALAEVRVTVTDAPLVQRLFAAAEDEIRRLDAENAELKRERDEWEDRYDELLAAVGGTWPG